MKTKTYLLSALAAFLFVTLLPVVSSAQETAPVAAVNSTADNIVQWLTPVLVPLLIAGVKKVIPMIPTLFLPLIAPVLGIAIDYAAHLASGHATNTIVAAALGLVGVGLREIVDQTKQTTQANSTS